jgi:hypothetical protein
LAINLKQILGDHADDPVSRQRFLLEAEITGGLEHPGIVPVYGLGPYDDGRPNYAMRFIRGDSLKEAIARFHGGATSQNDPGIRSLELRMLIRRFLDVCNAMNRLIEPALEAICLKAMALLPEDRYGSPRGLADDLERWAADEPVSGGREPFVERTLRWMRRRRSTVAAVAAATAVALFGLAAVLAVQAQANSDLTSANRSLAAASRRESQANRDLVAANQRERAWTIQQALADAEPYRGFRGDLARTLDNIAWLQFRPVERSNPEPYSAARGPCRRR